MFFGFFTQWSSFAATAPEQELLRLREPDSSVIDDLSSYIPEYLKMQGIPGAATALIRNGEVVWTEGFGVKNSITKQPVEADTLFEIASNSKIITAYIALRLVDQQILSLDAPLNKYLTEPWLPPSKYRDTISLRQVLSHTSGLGHGTPSRDNILAPGLGYSYSTVAYQYLQAVIEQVTGKSLESVAQSMVFAPLEMKDSSFIDRDELTQRVANGHLHALLPVLLFLLLCFILLIPVGLVVGTVVRIKNGSWSLSRHIVTSTLTITFGCTLVTGFVLLWMNYMLEFGWLFVLSGSVFVGIFLLVSIAARFFIRQLFAERPRRRLAWTIVVQSLIIVGVLSAVVRIANVPVPKWPAVRANASASMRSTTNDLAKFLLELSNPQILSAEMAEEMRTSQIDLSYDLSWGLGPGIYHGREGDAVWQWGQNFDFQSFMLIYPEHGLGIVVCTNNDLLKPDVALEMAHQALGGSIETIRAGAHLAYNYRAEDP